MVIIYNPCGSPVCFPVLERALSTGQALHFSILRLTPSDHLAMWAGHPSQYLNIKWFVYGQRKKQNHILYIWDGMRVRRFYLYFLGGLFLFCFHHEKVKGFLNYYNIFIFSFFPQMAVRDAIQMSRKMRPNLNFSSLQRGFFSEFTSFFTPISRRLLSDKSRARRRDSSRRSSQLSDVMLHSSNLK